MPRTAIAASMIRPAGGGAGMVLRADVLASAVDHARAGAPDCPVIALTPRGKPITQARVRELAAGPGVTLLCGRFEGFDERIFAAREIEEVSVGDIVLSGGEPAALLLLDACIRLLPGVMGATPKWGGGILRRGAARISPFYPSHRLGRARDPACAAIGGSREDRRLACSHGGGGYTVTQAGPLGASSRRSGPTCLWRAA